MDCMDALPQFSDKFFDLASVDPPYGISVAKHKGGKIVGGVRESSEAKAINPAMPVLMTA